MKIHQTNTGLYTGMVQNWVTKYLDGSYNGQANLWTVVPQVISFLT